MFISVIIGMTLMAFSALSMIWTIPNRYSEERSYTGLVISLTVFALGFFFSLPLFWFI